MQSVGNDASNSRTKLHHVVNLINSFTKRETFPVVEYGSRLPAVLSSGFDGYRLVKLFNK